MRKLIATLASLAALGLGGALAQDVDVDIRFDDATSQYVGGSLGIPGFQVYYHSEEMDFIGENSDVRFRLSVSPFGGFAVLVGADALFELSELDDEGVFNLYAGGGPAIGFAGATINGTEFGGVLFDVSGLLGVNYRVSEDLSVFAEGGAGFGFWAVSDGTASVGGFMPTFRSGLGVNYHF